MNRNCAHGKLGKRGNRMGETPANTHRIDALSLLPGELAEIAAEMGMPKFRAGQVFRWLHAKNAGDFSEMTDIPKNQRAMLSEKLAINGAQVTKKLVSKTDGTRKLLHRLHDGFLAESAVMEYRHGKSVCISTQAGCRMGCAFCASGRSGLDRNLSAGEMLAQVYGAGGAKRVVLMGCGEPLDNFANLLRFLELAGHRDGANIGQRCITISTCGIAPKIRELAALGLRVNLAVSLHAPNDGLRARLMPVAAAYPLPQLMAACRRYAEATARRVTYEYTLFGGVNDSEECAAGLAGLLKNTLCHVNLLNMNEAGGGFAPAGAARAREFMGALLARGIPATVRRSLGRDIGAACGQLRSGHDGGKN